MKFTHFIIGTILCFVLMSTNTHEYYVSVTTVEYAKKEKSIQIISQIFIDDFEHLLRQRYDNTITLNEIEEPEIIDTYIHRYLSEKLKLNINNTFLDFKFIGKDYKDDIVCCYLEIENIDQIQRIEVENKILFDILPEQQNIVRIKAIDKNKSYLLTPNKENCVLNFN